MMSVKKRGTKRSLESVEYSTHDGYGIRRVTIKLPTPTTVEECKYRLLSVHSKFVSNHLINRRGQIDPASLRNFIRRNNITLLPTNGDEIDRTNGGSDMFQTYLAAIDFLKHSPNSFSCE